MRLDFLCPHHRLALLEAPHSAASVWRDCDRRLRDERSLSPPTRLGLAGSALEAADIYLSALYQPDEPQSVQPTQAGAGPGQAAPASSEPEATAFRRLAAGDHARPPDSHTTGAFLLERYAASALRLMDMLCREGQRRLALVVLAGANAMVEQVSRAGADVHAALHACRRLTRDGMRLLGNGETARPRVATGAVVLLH